MLNIQTRPETFPESILNLFQTRPASITSFNYLEPIFFIVNLENYVDEKVKQLAIDQNFDLGSILVFNGNNFYLNSKFVDSDTIQSSFESK
jgi:hypothetical protein